ncbi:L,D-transpeptidase family protein [Tessaracoccus lacteus]|uniref:L,D-transpeptidase family protein n=1 Tax=Tessaracoccus lacteus TaxID=3041766 RepID=A0ABY8PX71_9ACTN|nr:L,D-transpeptidase family protein [Tessaracoccus sp. T21]WGT47076.1 L,D-transpeptidase family protein [Tessaracoccus sp. T21]
MYPRGRPQAGHLVAAALLPFALLITGTPAASAAPPLGGGAVGLLADGSSSTVYLRAERNGVKVYNSARTKVIKTLVRGAKVSATKTVSSGYRRLTSGHWIRNSDLYVSTHLYMRTTVDGVHAYAAVGGSVVKVLDKGTVVRMTHTVVGGYRQTSAGNWIRNGHLAQTGSSGTWGSCTVTLGGVKLAVDSEAGHLVTVNGTSGSYAVVTLWDRASGVKCSFTKMRSEKGRVGARGIVADAKRKQDTFTTPAGTYTMTQGFSVGSVPKTRGVSWRKVDGNDYWVQDNDSVHYNEYRSGTSGFDTSDAEHLIDYKTEYRYAIVIDFNLEKVRKKGAGIFLHVNGDGATAGCVSVSKSFMVDIVHAVDSGDLISIKA